MSRPTFHPDLRSARFLPRELTTGPRALKLMRALERPRAGRSPADVEQHRITAHVGVRLFRPAGAPGPLPALLWIHGGGLVGGTAAQDDPFCDDVRSTLPAVVASVEYRRAPEHPFPTPLEDCWSALRWLAQRPDVDPDRIAIGGASAGGGLAAALALLARERGDVRPAFQLLVYPMLDDRTTSRTDLDARALRMWGPRSNRFGWRSYLGTAVATDDVSPLAAPARATDLAGLPPAWIGVGTHDLFHDEDVAYARRLDAAGVECTIEVVPGAYHGFDAISRTAPVTRTFVRAQLDALARALT